MEVNKETQKQIVANEIQIYVNTLYLLEVRHRVNKKLGNAEAIKANEEEMVKVEQALDELKVIEAEIAKTPARNFDAGNVDTGI